MTNSVGALDSTEPHLVGVTLAAVSAALGADVAAPRRQPLAGIGKVELESE